MASISIYQSLNSTSFIKNKAFSASTPRKSSFFGKHFSLSKYATRPVLSSALNPITASSPSHPFDVVIIGAGIIGLTIARQFLIGSDLSVAVVDKAVPCSGATGAGQGYIWTVHKTPGSDTWDLTMRSHKLWMMLAESIDDQGLNSLEVLGWKKTGSMLIGRTPEELGTLKERVKQLSEAGLRAEYLSSNDLLLEEPALVVGEDSGAAFLPDDCQLDAMRTVAYIEKVNRHFASKGRYAEFYHDPVTCLLRSRRTGEVEAVQTSQNTLYVKKAIVVAAGSWSGSLVHDLFRETEIVLDVPVKPRKGHLLVLENFDSLKLNHGLMETSYVAHHDLTMNPGLVDLEQILSISMTATMDMMGNLVLGKILYFSSWFSSTTGLILFELSLLIVVTYDHLSFSLSSVCTGSSRQFAGFNTEVDESIINRIWMRAADFFPRLKDLSLADFTRSRKVRVGLRPYMPDGKPVIGPVPGLSNVFLATGHEGGGLSMALGTAEMVADMVLQNPLKIDSAPFTVQGRC
ncbi:hypothetical protein JRO89_XS01G0098800 [Xanthoceras sorbifolium]|uniref:FAD-dependent oxidoreductase domain-containing protein 1 n=1 Tax=Xanthoceras sorbifolium TaxID=99658 RepID=A0ABQ8IJ77_9ROSI|nr:hypothetical protein JRO89_XS01G0098800 [Xanthoceras sorbifolium]